MANVLGPALGAGLGGGVGYLEDRALQDKLKSEGALAHSSLVTNALLGAFVGSKGGRDFLMARDKADPTEAVATRLNRATGVVLPKLIAPPILHAASGGMGAVGNLTETTEKIKDASGNLAHATKDIANNSGDIMGGLKRTSQELGNSAGSLNQTLQDVGSAAKNTPAALENVSKATEQVGKSISQLGEAPKKVSDFLKGYANNPADWSALQKVVAGGAGVSVATLAALILLNNKTRRKAGRG